MKIAIVITCRPSSVRPPIPELKTYHNECYALELSITWWGLCVCGGGGGGGAKGEGVKAKGLKGLS